MSVGVCLHVCVHIIEGGGCIQKMEIQNGQVYGHKRMREGLCSEDG